MRLGGALNVPNVGCASDVGGKKMHWIFRSDLVAATVQRKKVFLSKVLQPQPQKAFRRRANHLGSNPAKPEKRHNESLHVLRAWALPAQGLVGRLPLLVWLLLPLHLFFIFFVFCFVC